MGLSISLIQDVIGGQWLHHGDPDLVIEDLLVDSRQLKFPEQTLFFAIKGLRQDGHRYINNLYDQGVRAFIVTEDLPNDHIAEATVIKVDDAVEALQQIVIHHRSGYTLPVLAITGSNGKTIVKEWLSHLLATSRNIIKTPKSYNSQIGVPLSVWQLSSACDLAIFEAGISQVGEMAHLEPIIQPSLGLFTNIGSAHAEGFESIDQKVAEKAVLFQSCDKVVICLDHEVINRHFTDISFELFTWSSTNPVADVIISVTSIDDEMCTLQYRGLTQMGQVSIPFRDMASIENASHCIAFLICVGESVTLYRDAFATLPVIEMRLEARQGVNQCLIINDAYSADMESLSVALSFARQQGSHLQKTVIMTDLLQQAESEDSLYAKVAKLLMEHEFSRVIGIGDKIQLLERSLDPDIVQTYYQSAITFVEELPNLQFQNEMILIKGARSFGLEVIANRLGLKQHHTVLEINLGALARNLKVFETYLNPGVKIMAMVKAAAYGSGSIEIARFLATRSIDYLAVAYMDEGIELRRAGVDLPILVLNSDVTQLPLMVEFNLEPEIFSIEQLSKTIDFESHHRPGLKIHLELETGMHRLGLERKDLPTLMKLLKNSTVRIESIFSHLAVSEAESEDEFTELQIREFEEFSESIVNDLPYRPLRHLLNSNGTVRHTAAQYDMVRLGIGMYGIGMPDKIRLEKVHRLQSFVSQIKHVQPGSTIGYGRREMVKGEIDIATVGIGYADGLIRKAGTRRYALVINGMPAPIVGNVCMDMTMVDITGIPGVEIGTPVIIFGEKPGIDELAQAGETIPYEIFTNLSERIKRVYIYE